MSDDDIWALSCGGHDPQKVYAAYAAALAHTDQPTAILAKTVKGYGMGEAGEGQNITHQQKKMGESVLRVFRDRFGIDVPDEGIPEVPFLRPADDSPELIYLRERREALGGGYLPVRRARATEFAAGAGAVGVRRAAEEHGRSGDLHDDGVRADPHHAAARQEDRQAGGAEVPDESRTFGMEGPVPAVRHLVPVWFQNSAAAAGLPF